MDYKLDEILHVLHTFLFADAEQIIVELRHNMLDKLHQEAEIAFISSKIFNSDESLLNFLRQNSQQNERLLSTVKKRIYELIIEYIHNRKQDVTSYLEQIRQTCLTSFISDPNSLVKEGSVMVLIKIIETYKEIEAVIRPKDLMPILFDEIKLRRPSATLKGAIWQLIGLLLKTFPRQLTSFMESSQNILLIMLEEQVRNKKPEIKAITGMLKGFQFSLEVSCTLSDQQKNQMFLLLTTLSQPIEDVSNRGVLKAAIKTLSQHAHLFPQLIMNQSINLIERALQLCTFENLEVRDVANELLGSLIQQISANLDPTQDNHLRIFNFIMEQFDSIVTSLEPKNSQLLSAIRAIGIFSSAIKNIMGAERLQNYMVKLSEISDKKLIKQLMETDRPDSDLQNFKYILSKQKQLIAFIESYSFIIRNLEKKPSEYFLQHFMTVGQIGVNNHRKLYHSYRGRFYEAIANLTMSLSGFEDEFKIWVQRFVRNSLRETLKIPDSVIYGGESPAESLNDCVEFWKQYLSNDSVWNQSACHHVYDELLRTCISDIDLMDLRYSLNREKTQSTDGFKLQECNAEYIANNSMDQQYMDRISGFLEIFLLQCHDEWLWKWVPTFCKVLVKKAAQTPRIPKIYTLMKSVIVLTQKHRYFEDDSNPEIDLTERNNTFNMLLAFLKELIGKSEEFQDQLLESAVLLLLNVPLAMLYSPQDESIDTLSLWIPVMLRALNLSALNNRMALAAISTLESWLNNLPLPLVTKMYNDILPKLSDFLILERTNDKKDTYFFQDLIKEHRETRIDRKEISRKVLDLLGKIGGHAHNIINNELRKKHEKENFIRWDTEKRLKFTMPLGMKKIDIYLDSCLPRIIDLAQNSTEKRTRIAACELLHGLVLYMIGKSATRPGSQLKQHEHENMAAFAKLYARLFPVIIRLATEIEEISRQLFEPLVFQIVRWFSSSKIHEHPEVESLLDAIIEGTQSRNNSTLREMCSNAMAVFAEWSLKQKSDKEIKDNPSNIQSLLRRVESNSNHPDCFKRLSSVLCLSKILLIIQKYDSLVDRFCLEIARCVLSSLKNCHNSVEFSQDVIENCEELLEYICKLILQNADILLRDNQERQIHINLHEFLDFLFSKFTAIETVFRREAQKLWEGLVLGLSKKFQAKSIILQKYVPQPGERAIYWQIAPIQFGMPREQMQQLGMDTKKAEYQELQRQMDCLTAQLDFIHWLITVPKFRYLELHSQLRIDLKCVKGNIQTFLFKQVRPQFEQMCQNSDEYKLLRLLTCEEGREQVTKAQIRALTALFALLNDLSDSEIADLIPQNSQQEDCSNYVFELAVQIMLVPAAHLLSLLVQDYTLEKMLRVPCEAFVKRTYLKMQAIEQQSQGIKKLQDVVYELCTVKIPQINLNQISQSNQKQYHPRLLTNLFVGYFKLATIDPEIKSSMQEMVENLSRVVYFWMRHNLPQEVESGRLVVSFVCHFQVENEVIAQWLSNHSIVYHKTSDLLLKYVADNWHKKGVCIGEYLVQKTMNNLDLLNVFLPVLEYVSEKIPGYQNCLIAGIPAYWQGVTNNSEYAEKQVQIYSIIIEKCKWTFEQVESNKEAKVFLHFVLQQVKNFLHGERYNVLFFQKVLSLSGLLYSLNIQELQYSKLTQKLEQFLIRHSPINSRELNKSEKESFIYEKLLEGYLDMLDISQSPEIILILKREISEHKSHILNGRIKNSLNQFVQNYVNTQDTFAKFQREVDRFTAIFYEQSYTQIVDNLRWAVADKVVARVFETCSLENLEQLMVKYFDSRFKKTLEKSVVDGDPLTRYLTVREKTHVFLLIEICVRRLDADTIKNKVTKQIFGPQAPANELTKYLIKQGEEASKGVGVEDFIKACDSLTQEIELPQVNSLEQVKRRYCCAGYTLLSSAILKTQTKQSVFTDFLFGTWETLIDPTESLYNFSVQTNFNSISLQAIEAKSFKATDLQKVRTHNLLKEYMTSSFMATNANFNSAMVFETQMAQETELPQLLAEVQREQQQQSGEEEPKVSTLEIDQVNKHECMKNIKRVLDKMHELFSSQWVPGELPAFMKMLLDGFKAGALNMRIFILKLLVNNQELFQPFAKFWIPSLCEFVTSKQTGGKGFHYFLRDLVTILIMWSDNAKPDCSEFQMASKVVNTLVRLAADKNKIIFNINIELLAMLMHKWRDVVIVDKEPLEQMLALDDSKETSHLWKMTAIQVVALCCSFDIPTLQMRPEYEHNFETDQKFKLEYDVQTLEVDKLLKNILKLQELKKKQLIFASSEAVGKILQRQSSLARFCLDKVMENDKRERHDIIVNVIERITRDFPQLLEIRKVFMKLISYINVMTGSMRAAIFKALARYYEICPKQQRIEIQKSVYAIQAEILADVSEENQFTFLNLLTKIIKTDPEAGSLMLREVVDNLKAIFVSNKSVPTRELYFDLMVYLYEKFEEFKVFAKSSLIHALADPSEQIRNKVFQYWNNMTRLDPDPFLRIEQLLTVLYDQSEEKVWLNNAANLLMHISTESADYNRKIFDQPLTQCQFDPMHINPLKVNMLRSQPVTPSLAKIAVLQATQLLEAKAIQKPQIQPTLPQIPESLNEDIEMEDQGEGSISPNDQSADRFKVAGQKSQSSGEMMSQVNARPLQVKPSQADQNVPLFQPSQIISSSLVISGLQFSKTALGLNSIYNSSQQQQQQPKSQLSISASQQQVVSDNESSQHNDLISSQTFYFESNYKKGFKVFQIPKEDGAEDQPGNQHQEEKYAIGQTHKKHFSVSRFMERQGIDYQPLGSASDGSMIRVVKDGSMPSQLARREEQNQIYKRTLMRQLNSLKKDKINMLRTYRMGDIPDIQIDFKDIILPLMVLVQKDSTIATEVLVELFTEIYKQIKVAEQRQRLGEGVRQILSRSTVYDYSTINCMHRVAIELLRIDGFTIKAEVIERTGRESMNYQTSMQLIEESIIQMGRLGPLSGEEKDDRAGVQSVQMNKLSRVNNSTKDYWFSLIQLNEIVGNEDALKGIWSSISEVPSVMLKRGLELSAQTEDIAKKIHQAHLYRSKGQISSSLNMLEKILESDEFEKQFEAQVQLEMKNKQYESYAELLKWDKVCSVGKEQHTNKQLLEIPKLQAEMIVRAQLRVPTQRNALGLQMQTWSQNKESKNYLDRQFNFEQALLYIYNQDYDRARFYIDLESRDLLSQWHYHTKLSSFAQHILVQKIQKIYEMKEFLGTIKQLSLKENEELQPIALGQIAGWVHRQPSFQFDRLSTWDDILTARLAYIEQYKLNFRNGSSFSAQLDGTSETKYQEIHNIQAKLYAQISNGAFKMGQYSSCDRYLQICNEQKKSGGTRDELQIVVPIIKLKVEQFKQETLNFSFPQKLQHLNRVLRVLESYVKKSEQQADIVSKIKAAYCKQKMHKKFVTIIYKDMQTQQEGRAVKELMQEMKQHAELAFKESDQIHQFLHGRSISKQEVMKAKTQLQFSKLCLKLLKYLENETLRKTIQGGLSQIGFPVVQLGQMAIRNAFQAINLGNQEARNLVPRLLEVLSNMDSQEVSAEFTEVSKNTPVWIFLKWIQQLVAYINRPLSEVISPKIRQIVRKYPHALFYAFQVLKSNLQIALTGQEKSQLYLKLEEIFDSRFTVLQEWASALNSLVHPEHRVFSWITMIEDSIKQGNKDTKTFVKLLIEDTCQNRKGYGHYNAKFATKWHRYFETLLKKSPDDLFESLRQVKEKIGQYALGEGEEKLSTFSLYLQDLDNNDFYNQEQYIEVPGQYENINQEPIPGKHVKVACLRKSILILGSIRRPKRITIHGSNEKDYNLLIKGGEDLRLDQRVQQVFSIMNQVFQVDPQCQYRDLNLKTFNIVPITNRLGALEWVQNTEPLKEMISRQHKAENKGKDLNESAALLKRRQFLKKLPANQGIDDIRQQHLALLQLESDKCITAFNQHKQLISWHLLRQGLENLCLTSSAFIAIKNSFIKSVAVLSIASYLLGIGDRHLENFLISTTDGEVLGIDYGCAFGFGVQLAVPELIPFRLTQQIEGVIAPHPMNSVYQQTMVHVMRALRKNKSLILDTCDIFVKEPLLDWMQTAKRKQQRFYNSKQTAEELEEQLSFYPKQKIEVLRNKLDGYNPVYIVHNELKESSHYKLTYYERLLEALQGPEGGFRERLLKDKVKYLEVEKQVECLIDLARCPDILGRAWIGWQAFI